MKKPFNDQTIDVLVKDLFQKEEGILDLRLKYIGDEGVRYLANAEELKGLKHRSFDMALLFDGNSEGIREIAEATGISHEKLITLWWAVWVESLIKELVHVPINLIV